MALLPRFPKCWAHGHALTVLSLNSLFLETASLCRLGWPCLNFEAVWDHRCELPYLAEAFVGLVLFSYGNESCSFPPETRGREWSPGPLCCIGQRPFHL